MLQDGTRDHLCAACEHHTACTRSSWEGAALAYLPVLAAATALLHLLLLRRLALELERDRQPALRGAAAGARRRGHHATVPTRGRCSASSLHTQTTSKLAATRTTARRARSTTCELRDPSEPAHDQYQYVFDPRKLHDNSVTSGGSRRALRHPCAVRERGGFLRGARVRQAML